MSLNVLIVEDAQALARNIAAFLQRRAIHVEITDTLGGAIERLESGTEFDVLLLDVGLPDGNGLEFFSQISPDYPELRMIAMSGGDLELPEIATRKAGGISFLAKPFALSRILDVLQYVAPGISASNRRDLEKNNPVCP